MNTESTCKIKKTNKMICLSNLVGNLNLGKNFSLLFESFSQCKDMQYLSKTPDKIDILPSVVIGVVVTGISGHVPLEKRQRKTATRLINCPFEFCCKRQDNGLWVINGVKNSSHNHEPSSDMSGHPSCRCLSEKEITRIEEMTRSGIPPRQILFSLRQSNPKLQVVSKTIYNTKGKIQKDNLAGRTMIQALFDELCPDEEAFNEAWKLVELLYKDKEKVVCYIRKTWLPFKEQFVHAWTENCAHFGNRVSSRAEGAHGKLKKYLQVSTGDLYQVKNKICLAIENEFKEITTQLSSERIRIPHNCNNYFFKELITKVSSFALRKLVDQYEMLKHGTMKSTCMGHFMASMGLPCAHKMIDWKGKMLPFDAIHSQWRIDTRSFAFSGGSFAFFGGGETNLNGEEFKRLVLELDKKYKEWPASQRERVQERISQLVNPSLPLAISTT
ncbi:hypothetical protein RHGRI_028764 [Rhododendron griersonianum]|uniref:Protein FAR1-RELATED SEQUENCE n=1 Tax=Rhododendron griersonianum TaxID=479676 RepID=A0AAV6IHS2_9ERIC|nr:hypothetical protein RHGRI_028764 [Rhododendron griersonianum]